ncbi:hypothetical protein M9194_09130 [Vibrio sp. S4M6]|uniref:hypothetical protein n=1 Tax=Vibrio sinus TaxID=2946865 RepID=UPI00202A05F3|nr:hypothetical protein [Vibrio sinus]MCL9781587.1 hypothetical protein [Vibrio sinus]
MKIAILSPEQSQSSDNRITVVNGFPMYQSTGESRNTQSFPGIWFPMICVAGRELNPTIVKPFDDQDLKENPNLLEEYFTRDVIKAANNKYLLQKLGCMQCMGISIAIDNLSSSGGLWDEKPKLRKIKKYFMSRHSEWLPVIPPVESSVETLTSCTSANDWLIENMSRFNYREGNVYAYKRRFQEYKITTRRRVGTSETSPLLGRRIDTRISRNKCHCVIL